MRPIVLLLLGLCCGVYSRDCLHPAALDNFNKENFEGEWYSMAFSTPNTTEAAYYQNTRCSFNTFKLANNSSFSGIVDYLIVDRRIHYTGEYKMEDRTRAKLRVKFPGYPLVYAYDVVCTDYNNWAITYACSQLDAGHSSEFISLLGRDRTAYSQIITDKEAKNCIQEQLHISIDELKKTPQDSCNNN